MDRETEALVLGVPPGIRKSLRATAEFHKVPYSTLKHRKDGRRSLIEKAQDQQYLYPWEEKALVKFVVQRDNFGRPIRVKDLGSLAYKLACRQRSPASRPGKPPGKNWPQSFYKRHPAIKAKKTSALDWNRYDIHDKVAYWFEIIGKVLLDPAILPSNVYNMDETGVMLSQLNSVKVLVSKDSNRGYRGARVKRTTITAIECVSADGRCLNPMIIWPASTHRANWTTHDTPGWHYAYSDSGYTDSYISLQWLKLVFDPQTRQRANGRSRVLICDGFGTHETLESLEFCFENNIILCRIPSHSSHKTQPCDISLFGPLKVAYREQVERLERGHVGTIGKEHFTYLYSPARDKAFTSRNIRAGWAKAGLFPFNPDKVLSDIPKPISTTTQASEVQACSSAHDEVPQTPVTPVTAEAVSALHNQIKQDACALDEANRQRLHRHVQKLHNATQLSLAERAILEENNKFLAEINNEAKSRRRTKSEIQGVARVVSFEDIQKERAHRAAQAAETAAKKAAKEAKRIARATTQAKEVEPSKAKRGRKRRGAVSEHGPGEVEQIHESSCISDMRVEGIDTFPTVYRAPEAKMY